jgi:hypothetical protein
MHLFWQIHRSTLVNVKAIAGVTPRFPRPPAGQRAGSTREARSQPQLCWFVQGDVGGGVAVVVARAPSRQGCSAPDSQWDGLEHFESALDAGKGVICLAPHLGCWEMIAQCPGRALWPDTRPTGRALPPGAQGLAGTAGCQFARPPGLKAVPTSMSGVRSLIRVARSGGYTGILPDQVPPLGQGVWAPFFGRPAYTMTLLSRLAQQTGARVLLTWCEGCPLARAMSCTLSRSTHAELRDASASPRPLQRPSTPQWRA